MVIYYFHATTHVPGPLFRRRVGRSIYKKKRIVQTLKDGKTLKQRIIRMFRVPNCRFQCPNVFALSLHQWNTAGFAEARQRVALNVWKLKTTSWQLK